MTTARPALVRVWLVRHGETEWSLSGQHTGRTDITLTAHGEEQARGLGLRLRETTFANVLSSPLKRARQTCTLAGVDATPEIDPDLAEWDYGGYEGLTSAEIHASRPDWNIFRNGAPNGETPKQVSARADRLIARLRSMEGNIAVFSHGHFGRVLGVRWIGLPIDEAQHFLLDTASLSVLGYEHHRTDQPAIALWNSASPGPFDSAPRQEADDSTMMLKRAIERWENEGGEIPPLPK